MLHDVHAHRQAVLLARLVHAEDLPVLGADAHDHAVGLHLGHLLRRHVVVQRVVLAARDAVANHRHVLNQRHRRGADEGGDEGVARVLVQRVRGVDLLDDALLQHADAVTHRHRLGLVVRDVDRGGVQLPLQLQDLGASGHAQLRVQVGQGLVHEEDLRLAHDRAAHGHALALAAGHGGRLAVDEVLELEHLRREVHTLLNGRLVHLGVLQGERHVLARSHVGVQRVGLEDHGHVSVAGAGLGDVGAVDKNLPLVNRLQPGEHAQRGGLAAARRADKHQELAVGDLQVEAADRRRLLRIVDPGGLAEFNSGHDVLSAGTKCAGCGLRASV